MIGRLGNRYLMWQAMASASMPSFLFSRRIAGRGRSSNALIASYPLDANLTLYPCESRAALRISNFCGRSSMHNTVGAHGHVFLWVFMSHLALMESALGSMKGIRQYVGEQLATQNQLAGVFRSLLPLARLPYFQVNLPAANSGRANGSCRVGLVDLSVTACNSSIHLS
jgi:hypothetical protein